MRLHRFFVSQSKIGEKEIRLEDKNLTHQWKSVFRLESGDSVILFSGDGFDYTYEIKILSKNEAELILQEKIENKNTPVRAVYLFASLVKKDNFEWILEKGTELGVSHFIPVVSERTEKKDLNMERAQKIVIEASEQSGRGSVPAIHKVVSLEDSLKEFSIPLFAFHTEGAVSFRDLKYG